MIAKGTKVRIKEDEIDGFVAEFKRRVRGRVGVVTGHTHGRGTPIVTFPAEGRRKEYNGGLIHERFLEVVEQPANTEVAA